MWVRCRSPCAAKQGNLTLWKWAQWIRCGLIPLLLKGNFFIGLVFSFNCYSCFNIVPVLYTFFHYLLDTFAVLWLITYLSPLQWPWSNACVRLQSQGWGLGVKKRKNNCQSVCDIGSTHVTNIEVWFCSLANAPGRTSNFLWNCLRCTFFPLHFHRKLPSSS